jgi:preprotein translocase subunit SecD
LAILASIRIAVAEPLLLDVGLADTGHDQQTGEPAVRFVLTFESALKFARLTAQNVGHAIEMRVDGRAFSRPVIREPILAGSGMIFGEPGRPLSEQDARDLAARLSAGAKLEIEVVAN